MNRQALEYLKEWKTRQSRKPLVIRGARQVGKSYLIRQFAGLEEVDCACFINRLEKLQL